MTCYLTDEADPRSSTDGFARGVFAAAKLYPAHATTNSAHGVTDVANIRSGAGRDGADRNAAAHPWRGDRSRGRHIRPGEGLHRPHLLGPGPRFPGAEDGVRAYHHRRGGRFRPGRGRQCRRDRHAAPSRHQPQRPVRRRDQAACLLPARRQARGASAGGPPRRDLRLAQILPRHRQRPARGRAQGIAAAAAPASSTRPSPWKAMPRCSRRKARSTGSKPSPRRTARASTACRSTRGGWRSSGREVDGAGHAAGGRDECRALPRRRDLALAIRAEPCPALSVPSC